MEVWRDWRIFRSSKVLSAVAIVVMGCLSLGVLMCGPGLAGAADPVKLDPANIDACGNPAPPVLGAPSTIATSGPTIVTTISSSSGFDNDGTLNLTWSSTGDAAQVNFWCVAIVPIVPIVPTGKNSSQSAPDTDQYARCPHPEAVTGNVWKCSILGVPTDPKFSVAVRAHTSGSDTPPWSTPLSVPATTTPPGAPNNKSNTGGTTATTSAPNNKSNTGGTSSPSKKLLYAALIAAITLFVLVAVAVRRSTVRRQRESHAAGGATMGESSDLYARPGRNSGRRTNDFARLEGTSEERALYFDERPVSVPPEVPGMVFLSADAAPDLGGAGALRVHPSLGERGVTWATPGGAVFGGGLWSEKRKDHGEDAEPYFRYQRDGHRTLVAVFDGMGGSGGAVSRQTHRGAVTQAYDASRLARLAAERWFATLPAGALDPSRAAQGLHDDLFRVLADRASSLEGRTSGLVGTLKRTFPTTLAAAVTEQGAHGTRVVALWAGDSRTYILTPSRGLQQVSRDDTAEQDALVALLADPPIDNVICADRDFVIHHAEVVEMEPFVVVVASDGCFGYVPTPPLFEVQMLRTLASANSSERWMQALLEVLEVQAQDDTSLSVAAIGFSDFGILRQAFAARTLQVEEQFGAPFERLVQGGEVVREQFEQFRTDAWEAYRPTYEALMPQEVTIP